MGIDSNGYWPNWNKLISGSNLMFIGVIAVATAATVLSGGTAAPLLITAIAYTTAAAGVATAAYGLSEVGESFTGHNVIRDDLLNGNDELYNKSKDIVTKTAIIGTTIIGAYNGIKLIKNYLKMPEPDMNNLPPGWNEDWEWRYPANRPSSEQPRWFDTQGGEWRWHYDSNHPIGHWDYNPWDAWNSPWKNIFPK